MSSLHKILLLTMFVSSVSFAAQAQTQPPSIEEMKDMKLPVQLKLEDVNAAMAECRATATDLQVFKTCFDEKHDELEKAAKKAEAENAEEAPVATPEGDAATPDAKEVEKPATSVFR